MFPRQEFCRLLQEIKEGNILIIVEGKKDKRALEELGLTNIITLYHKPLYKIMEELPAKEVIILTDFDKEGKKLYGKLRQECLRLGIKVNNKLRNFLIKEARISHIEGLTTFIYSKENTNKKHHFQA